MRLYVLGFSQFKSQNLSFLDILLHVLKFEFLSRQQLFLLYFLLEDDSNNCEDNKGSKINCDIDKVNFSRSKEIFKISLSLNEVALREQSLTLWWIYFKLLWVRTRPTNWIAKCAKLGRIARSTAHVIWLGSFITKRTIKYSIWIDWLFWTIDLVSLIDVDPHRANWSLIDWVIWDLN